MLSRCGEDVGGKRIQEDSAVDGHPKTGGLAIASEQIRADCAVQKMDEGSAMSQTLHLKDWIVPLRRNLGSVRR
jgi:hypothetical protein